MSTETEAPPSKDSKIKGALCYLPTIGWIISLFLILTERHDRFVRFHALQGLLLLGVYFILWAILNLISGVLLLMIYAGILIGLISRLLLPAYLIISFYVLYHTFEGEKIVLPIIGATAEKHK
jgi:uncharacterized membrane protein